jgi:hypothetical protein
MARKVNKPMTLLPAKTILCMPAEGAFQMSLAGEDTSQGSQPLSVSNYNQNEVRQFEMPPVDGQYCLNLK